MDDCLIRGTVEFERCLPESIPSIRTTTRRMALRDALESSRDVQKFAEEYESELNALIQQLESGRVIHMKQQPVFEWEIAGQPYFSANWRFEHMMVHHVITKCKFEEGLRVAEEGDYKTAKKSFVDAAQHCETIMTDCIKKWPFHDMVSLKMTHEGFWHCQKKYCEAFFSFNDTSVCSAGE